MSWTCHSSCHLPVQKVLQHMPIIRYWCYNEVLLRANHSHGLPYLNLIFPRHCPTTGGGCTRSHTDHIGCSSVTFPTHGVPYTKVCGRAQGYQYYAPPAFHDYHNQGQTTLDSSYVSGLSVTYGSPRSHRNVKEL